MTGDDAEPAERSRPSGREDPIDRLFRDETANALLAWGVTGALGVAFVASAQGSDHHWLVFVACLAVVVLIPPVAFREWHVMLPWEVLALATAPVLVRALAGGALGTFAAFLAVAGMALLVTVELHTFTSLEVTHWFAVTFVVLTTLASVAAWTVVRWYVDRALGTSYLSTNEALMREWLVVAAAGLIAGVLFDAYFQRRDRQLRRAVEGWIGR